MAAQVGIRRTIPSKPSGTTLTTIYTMPFEGVATLYSVNIAAISAADASVVFNDSSADYELLSAQTMAADDTILLEWREGIPLRKDDVLKVKTSSGSALIFVAVIEEAPPARTVDSLRDLGA